MSSTTTHRYLNNRIAIDIEPTENEPNTSDRTYEINDTNEDGHDKVVEKYLQSLLRPMDIMQNVCLCAKYKIRNDVITPNSRLYSVLSVCSVVILMVFICIMFFLTSIRTAGMDIFVYFVVNIYDYVLYFIGGFLNAFTNIRQRLNNVLFVLKIQKVHRILNLNGSYFKHFTISNWIYVAAINCYHFVWTCMYFYAFYDVGIANILASYLCCIRYDMNMIYATRSMTLVYESLRSWLEELRKSGYVEDEQHWDNLFESYTDILQVFEILEKTFHGLVLFYVIHTSSNTLLDIWLRVEMRSVADTGDIQYILLAFMSLTWVIKNILLLTSLSVENERFYSEITEVQSTCIQIITSGRCSVTRKRFCKNIQRVQNATFKKMNVCGMFTIDAEMPLRVLDLITTYTIVLLQFEFL